MRKFVQLVVAETALYAGIGFMGWLTESFPGWVWGVVVVASLAILIGMYWQDAKRAIGSRSFDAPISEAVEHYARTVPHSYRDGINLHAFEVLHKAMCAGKLPVVGIRGEDASSERVSARTCKRLNRGRWLCRAIGQLPLGYDSI